MTVDHWRDYEYDADLDAAEAARAAANSGGVISTHTEPERPANPYRQTREDLPR